MQFNDFPAISSVNLPQFYKAGHVICARLPGEGTEAHRAGALPKVSRPGFIL